MRMERLTLSWISITEVAEKQLALCLLSFPTVVREVAETLQPHKLCGYLYELATTFSTFYETCPVLRAELASQRTTRLKLCELAAQVLARGLQLLGIDAPERM